jgi:transcriptional regulator of acetoin/glycerol metabolism
MSTEDITTILFRRLHSYIGYGLITWAQLHAIERHELQLIDEKYGRATDEQRKLNKAARLKKDLQTALDTSEGNRKDAARIMGISERTLYRYMNQFNIQ